MQLCVLQSLVGSAAAVLQHSSLCHRDGSTVSPCYGQQAYNSVCYSTAAGLQCDTDP